MNISFRILSGPAPFYFSVKPDPGEKFRINTPGITEKVSEVSWIIVHLGSQTDRARSWWSHLDRKHRAPVRRLGVCQPAARRRGLWPWQEFSRLQEIKNWVSISLWYLSTKRGVFWIWSRIEDFFFWSGYGPSFKIMCLVYCIFNSDIGKRSYNPLKRLSNWNTLWF